MRRSSLRMMAAGANDLHTRSPISDFDIKAHNEAVAKLWNHFSRGENERVPIVFASDEALWLKLTGNTFREFYTAPQRQFRVQLEGAAWFAENIVHDRRMGPPKEAWTVTPRFWMAAPEFFDCEIVIQENDFAWSKPLTGEKRDILKSIANIDPAERVKQCRLWRLYAAMKDMAEGMMFRGLPVRIGSPGGGSHGIFTNACRVRGIERLCMDMVEDPDFAIEFLRLVTEKLIARNRAWRELTGASARLPSPQGWGMADDSLQLISAEMYERFVLPCHERIYSAMTTGERRMHLCGRAQQHYRILYERLGIREIDGPGTFVDHGEYLSMFPNLRINAQGEHTILMLGPVSAVREMMRSITADAARQPGRFQVMGFLSPATPLSHVRVMYEAGKEYGRIRGGEER